MSDDVIKVSNESTPTKRKYTKKATTQTVPQTTSTNKINILTEVDLQHSANEYMRQNNDVIDSFSSDIFNDGIIKTIDASTLQTWLANPEEYISEIEKLTTFYYISNPNVFQMYDLSVSLPSLNFKLKTDDYSRPHKDNSTKVKKAMKLVRHKELTRDIISQTAATGTLCAIWLGTKNEPYLHIFDSLDYVFPARRVKGNWTVWVDLSWFNTMNDVQKNATFETLSPYVTKEDYEFYKKDPQNIRYVELPQEKSVCIRTHTLYRGQRFGTAWSTQSFFDILHKEKLKSLEKSISNKVINSVAVLTVGNKEYEDSKLSEAKKKKVYLGVKKGLEKNSIDTSGITVIGIPHWSSIEFPDIKTDGLDPKKFESIDKDINSASSGVMNVVGGASNYSAGNLSLDVIYRKISVMLEQIEQEAYQKLINWILSNEFKNVYSIEYEKTKPLSTKEKITVLEKLNTTFGFSLKAVIDELEGIDFDQYIEDTMYEQNTLKLPEKVRAYASAFTQSGSDASGAPVKDDVATASTESTKTNDGNSNPSAT